MIFLCKLCGLFPAAFATMCVCDSVFGRSSAICSTASCYKQSRLVVFACVSLGSSCKMRKQIVHGFWNTIWWCGRCRQIQRGTADADNKHDCVRRTDYLCGELACVVWRRAGSATRRINAWSRECLIIRCGGTFPFVSVWILRILWRIDRISGARRYRSGFYKYARGM